MKNYFIIAVVAAVSYTALSLLLDLIFKNIHSTREYVISAIIFGLLYGVYGYLDDKGWNSWKKVGSLFKRKKTD